MARIDPRRDADGGCWVTFDPNDSTWTVCSTPPGPAGPATLPLGRAGTLTVDWADCFRFTSLLVPHPHGGLASPAARLVMRLLGRPAFDRMLTVSGKSGKAFLVEMDDGAVERCRSLCLLALLEDLRDDSGAAGTQPSLWAAEAACLRDASGLPGVQEAAAIEAARGAQALLALEIAELPDAVLSRCREVASKLIPLVPQESTVTELERFVERAAAAEPRPAEASASRSVEYAAAPDVDLPAIVAKLGVRAHVGGRLEWSPDARTLSVHVATRSGDLETEALWARAFTAHDGTLVALAPFAAAGGARPAAAAHLRLPRALDPGHVVVDVTPDPRRGVAPGRSGMLARAADLGRRATEAERLGLVDKAVRLWTRCAEAWEMLDDPERAVLALGYAAASLPSGDPRRASTLEPVGEHAPALTWADTYLDAPREVPPPFLAEMIVEDMA